MLSVVFFSIMKNYVGVLVEQVNRNPNFKVSNLAAAGSGGRKYQRNVSSIFDAERVREKMTKKINKV
jgi:hypothetical protein